MKILLLVYGLAVITFFVCGLALWWYSADKGTHSDDYKLAKIMIKYALVFPYGLVKIVDFLEHEGENNDL